MDDYSEDAVAPGHNVLASIALAALQFKAAESEVAKAELALTVAKEKLRVLQQDILPALMETAGQKECTTHDGYVVTVGEDLFGALPKGVNEASAAKRARGISFILEHEPSIIKSVIEAEIGKPRLARDPADQEAENDRHAQKIIEAMNTLRELGCSPRRIVDVHSSTLKAFAREMMVQGVNVPFEDLGLHQVRKVTIKEK